MADPLPAPPRLAPARKPAAGRWRESVTRLSLGLWALGFAIALVLVEAVAIAVGGDGHWTTARILAEVVIGLSVGSFLLGLVGALRHDGRRLGLIAAVLSVLANPLVQIWLLGVLGGS
ncbi:MAG: hypothetical protein JWM49_2770 [Microbacteriaceae bacterium]|jgi:hypothetical protein|nr:hypothetical protein [Microbacteriaceae bacterium]